MTTTSNIDTTDEQDVEIQTEQLIALAVPRERIFIDKGFSGTTRM